ncbi:MAG: hypothetical protein JWL77_3279 [Chthonomonadaceae bacterium]|nr:hypothetical protein [Chthonomonadaceae bacterium]
MLAPKPSLLQRSVPVTTYSDDLQWCLSASEVVLYHPYAVPFPLIEYRNARAGSAHTFPVPFRDLNRKFSIEEISPDGKWIKWYSGSHGGHLVTYNVETHRSIVWPSVWGDDNGVSFWWMPDSRHWLGWNFEAPGYLLHDVDHPQDIQKITLKSDFPDKRISVCSKQILFYPEDDRTFQKPARKGMDLVSYALANFAEPHQYHPAIETDGEITQFVFSPDGDHIAWLLTQIPDSAPIRLLQRLLPSRLTPFQPSQSIWITRLDGSHPHELGSLTIPFREQSVIGNLHWLPDGKQVSFGSGDFIYVTTCSDSL